MVVNPKFKVGDTILHISYTDYEGQVTCVVCNGDAKIRLKDESLMRCPKCDGKGTVGSYGDECWRPEIKPQKIIQINIRVGRHGILPDIDISYITRSGIFLQKDCFYSIEDAIQECENRNFEPED